MAWYHKLFGLESPEERQAKLDAHLKAAREAAYEEAKTRMREDQEPQASFTRKNGKLEVTSYNKAFVNSIRSDLAAIIPDGATDDEVIALYVGRENIEREEPKLTVLHSGIEDDGRIRVELDWNQAFIKHLAKHGITGETDEDAVSTYLQQVVQDAGRDLEPESPFDNPFEEIDEELSREYDEAARQLKHGTSF